MASLKLSFTVDNNSFESKKIHLNLKSLKFASVSNFSSYVNATGTFVVKPFCELKQIRVSKLDNGFSDVSEPKLDDYRVDNTEKFAVTDEPDENLNVESPYLGSDFRKRRIDIWKNLRGKKTARRSIKYGNRYKSEQKYVVTSKKTIRSPVLDGKSVVDCNFDEIGSDLCSDRCNIILDHLEKNNDEKALRFFQLMKVSGKLRQNVTAYNLIFRVLGRKLDWERAEMLIKEMVSESDCELTFQFFNTIIYSCYKKGIVDVGSKFFRMMMEYEVQPNIATFGMLMSLYQKGWAVEEAEFTFSKMRDLKITCQSAYSSMITIYTRKGLYNKAESVIALLREDQVVLNQENWLVLLNAYCQQGKLSDAEQVLFAMRKSGFSPNVVAYNTMITGYGKSSCMDRAESLFLNFHEFGVEPDETTYRSLIEGWGRAGNYNMAKHYYLELKRLGFQPNPSNLYTLIRLQVEREDDESAIRTIDDMVTIGCEKSSVLGIVIQSYEKANRLEKLPWSLKGSLYDHVLENQNSCAILVAAYVKNCLIDTALKVMGDKRWQDPLFEDNLYHLLICSCKDLGHLEDSIKIFTHMPKSGKPNLNIYCTMIGIYSAMSLFSEAEELYKELVITDVKLDMIAFSVVIRMYVKSGYLDKACEVVDVMEKQTDVVPDVYLLRDMLRIYQRSDMHERLADLYYKVLKDSESWDEEMYNCAINCCSRALPVDELSRLFDEMLHRGFEPSTITFNVMLHAYGKSKMFKRARKVLWMAKKRGLADVVSYNTIIASYGKNRYLRNMSAAVKKMQFDGFSVSLEAYNCMLDAYGKEKEMEKFRDVLLRMKASNVDSDRYTYNILINIYGEQGWIEEVGCVLRELKECGIRPDLCSYNTLIKAYGIAGMVEEGVDLVKEMRENGIEPDRRTYTNLINALKRNDMFLEAVKWSLWMKQMGL